MPAAGGSSSTARDHTTAPCWLSCCTASHVSALSSTKKLSPGSGSVCPVNAPSVPKSNGVESGYSAASITPTTSASRGGSSTRTDSPTRTPSRSSAAEVAMTSPTEAGTRPSVTVYFGAKAGSHTFPSKAVIPAIPVADSTVSAVSRTATRVAPGTSVSGSANVSSGSTLTGEPSLS